MDTNKFDIAEDIVKQNDSNKEIKKSKSKSHKGKLIAVIVLFVVCISVGINSYYELKAMNQPPEITDEELNRNMDGYLFMVIAQLNAYEQQYSHLPQDEEAFLGEDDLYIDYAVSGNTYRLSVTYADTTIVFNSGDNASDLLTEETLQQMGVTAASQAN